LSRQLWLAAVLALADATGFNEIWRCGFTLIPSERRVFN
jgi:hypothetical protein